MKINLSKTNYIKSAFNMIWLMDYLPRETTSDEVLRDKVFNIVKNPNYDGYERKLASVI